MVPSRSKASFIKRYSEGEATKAKTLIEGILLFVISLFGTVEGFRLNISSHQTLTSMMGPGTYILVLSLGIMITSIAHFFVNYKKDTSLEKVPLKKEMGIPKSRIVVYMVGAFAIYLLLISLFGYLVPTIIFFLVEFRLAGVKSWVKNIVLTLILTATFYFVFLQYCQMIFPRGIFFK